MLGVSCVEFIDMFQEAWIYKLVRVTNKVPECRIKIERLLLKALELL